MCATVECAAFMRQLTRQGITTGGRKQESGECYSLGLLKPIGSLYVAQLDSVTAALLCSLFDTLTKGLLVNPVAQGSRKSVTDIRAV